jgi:hypothetical protein
LFIFVPDDQSFRVHIITGDTRLSDRDGADAFCYDPDDGKTGMLRGDEMYS